MISAKLSSLNQDSQLSALLEKFLNACTDCGICEEECLFLKEFDIAPGQFAEKVSNQIVDSFKECPKEFDVYFSEGAYAELALEKKKGGLNKNSKLVVLFADPRLFYLKEGKEWKWKKNKIGRKNYLKRKVSEFLIKQIDGTICFGKFQKDLFRKFNKTAPARIVYGFVSNERHKKFSHFKPELKNKNILFVGNGPDYYCKGLDFLLRVFRKVREKSPESKLFILGDWQDINVKKLGKENIFFLGKQKNIEKYMKKCSLYVHLGRGDAFPVSSIEMMVAGIPVMVSKFTGTKEIVEKVSKNLVCSFNVEESSKKILDYFDLNEKRKKILGKKFRIISKKFNEQEMSEYFKKQFDLLMRELG